jgi:APA family basic amino acid/polyamine antiporter
LLPRWIGVNRRRRHSAARAHPVGRDFKRLRAGECGGGTQRLFEYLILVSTSSTLWLYLACALAALRLGVSRALAVAGAAYALWALWGADLKASGLSVVLMVAGLPIYWWAARERAVMRAEDRYSAG